MIIFPCSSHPRHCAVIIVETSHLVFIEVFWVNFICILGIDVRKRRSMYLPSSVQHLIFEYNGE